MRKNSKARGAKSKLSLERDATSSQAIGYGKPPVNSRFVPGKSGNPKGRPKGQLNLETELKNELNRTITVREGIHSRRLKKGVAWLVRTINGALNNDPKANATLVALLRTFVLGQQPQGGVEPPLTINDQDLLNDYLQRLEGQDDHGKGDADAGSPRSSDSQKLVYQPSKRPK